ncbi:MAG TPA: GspE/PulE family protein [Clostridia bacterium]|nr:GspE/PulE family protein [Clostridia bacterium]
MSQLLELLKMADSPDSAPELLDRLVQHAEKAGASDIHLQMRPDRAEVSFRLDGVLTSPWLLPFGISERLIGRIKFLARLKTYQESLPQDGRIEKSALRSAADLRVATYPTVTGEKIVLRMFGASDVRGLNDLGLPADIAAGLTAWLNRAAGLLLLTGPAGSGKTTTIYACLQQLAAGGGRHIITVEDPVEQVIPGIMQTEVNEARGLDFAKAARHLLRQDPQVLGIGEIRDEETARIALRAALTGHMVISTLHAGSCQGVLERLDSFCSDPSAVVASVDLIINQRLVRRLCTQCSGAGCESCLMSGFNGRLPLMEMLRVGEPERTLIRNREFQRIVVTSPLEERARTLTEAGLTTLGEIRRVL